eukprot:GFYU01003516.1.p1 GENE.GFYU01003516.1~~GFYU01003516.1.p1  ORF type:complete len:167 (-),score=81.99 GFYU01003516.1:160-660(-)
MIVYKDLFCGDELISDSWDIEIKDDIFIVAKGKYEVIMEGDVDIGANPSAEEEAEALENGGQQVVNIVHGFRLVETSFDKKSFVATFKGYMKKVAAHLEANKPERVEAFKAGAAKAFKEDILGRFDDLQFFTGESMDCESMVVTCYWEGESAFFQFWLDGLEEMKV